MAEQVRSIEEILQEMFIGVEKNTRNGKKVRERSSLMKLADLQEIADEMDLHLCRGLPLDLLKGIDVVYFSKRFMEKGVNVYYASLEDKQKARKKLGFAIQSCLERNERLINELNQALREKGLDEIKEVRKFLDFLTYNPQQRRNGEGNPLFEKPPYSHVPIIYYQNREDYKAFKEEIRSLLKSGKMVSMQDVYRNVSDKRKMKQLKNNIARRASNAVIL